MGNEIDLTGKQIGNYRLIAELTKNFSIVVYLAQHIFLDRRFVVLKLLHTALHAPEKQKRESFFQEASFLDRFKHPFILPLVDAGLFEDMPYVMTEYAPNGSLKDRLARQFPAPLPLEETLTILLQVGQAVQFLHDHNVVHCDLKPANILFNARCEALLADFGFALTLTAPVLRQERAPGTLHYIAPEKFDGIINREGDQYGLGCIAYELVTGQRPFVDLSIRGVMLKHKTEEPVPPTRINPQVPSSIEQAILKAMAKEPTARHANVTAFLAALGLPVSPVAPLTPLSAHRHVPMATLSTSIASNEAHTGDEGEKSSEQWLDEASVHYEARRFPQALAAYEAALLLDPDEAYIYIGKGLVLCELALYEQALASFEHAITLDPADAYAYVCMGLALRMLGNYEQALDTYQHAIALDHSDAAAYLGKALTLEQMAQFEQALQACEEALEWASNDITAWQHKGDILQRLDRAQEAQQAYEKARQLSAIAQAAQSMP